MKSLLGMGVGGVWLVERCLEEIFILIKRDKQKKEILMQKWI